MAAERTATSASQYSPHATKLMIGMLKIPENFKDRNGEAVVPGW